MFVDTSAVVALLAGEPEARRLARTLDGAKVRYTSGVVLLDATMRLSARLDIEPAYVETRVQALIETAGIIVIPITASIARKAAAVFALYGEGRGHIAALTLQECLSCACAEAYRVPLLFTGERFAATDVRIA